MFERILPTPLEICLGVVACACNPATLETEFRNGVGLIPGGSNSLSFDWWVDCVTICNPALG